jgi:hypothetical protein
MATHASRARNVFKRCLFVCCCILMSNLITCLQSHFPVGSPPACQIDGSVGILGLARGARQPLQAPPRPLEKIKVGRAEGERVGAGYGALCLAASWMGGPAGEATSVITVTACRMEGQPGEGLWRGEGQRRALLVVRCSVAEHRPPPRNRPVGRPGARLGHGELLS